MIELSVDGMRLEVWRSPRSAMPDGRREALIEDLWELLHDGFPAIAELADDDDLVEHFLDTATGAYLFDGDRCRGTTTADVLELPGTDVLYLSGTHLHSSVRGRGLFGPLILLRLALGRVSGCDWWATRTQNPIVAHQYRAFTAHPWGDDAEAARLAQEVAAAVSDGFGVLGRRGDQAFDQATSVLRRAHPTSPHEVLPPSPDPEVADHFADHVDHERGDAILLLGRVDDAIEVLAPACEARLGLSFDDLCTRLQRI